MQKSRWNQSGKLNTENSDGGQMLDTTSVFAPSLCLLLLLLLQVLHHHDDDFLPRTRSMRAWRGKVHPCF